MKPFFHRFEKNVVYKGDYPQKLVKSKILYSNSVETSLPVIQCIYSIVSIYYILFLHSLYDWRTILIMFIGHYHLNIVIGLSNTKKWVDRCVKSESILKRIWKGLRRYVYYFFFLDKFYLSERYESFFLYSVFGSTSWKSILIDLKAIMNRCFKVTM